MSYTRSSFSECKPSGAYVYGCAFKIAATAYEQNTFAEGSCVKCLFRIGTEV